LWQGIDPRGQLKISVGSYYRHPIFIMANQPVSLTKLAQWSDRVPQDSVEFQRSQQLETTTPFGVRHSGSLVSLRELCAAASGDPKARALAADTFSAGGATIQSTLQDEILQPLLKQAVTTKLGARLITGLRGNFANPVTSAPPTVYNISESTAVSNDTATTFSQPQASPLRLTTGFNLSAQVPVQAKDREFDQWLSGMTVNAIASMFDGIALSTIINTSGLSQVTFGGAPSLSVIRNMVYDVSALNFGENNRGFVTSPNSVKVLSQTQQISGSNFPRFLCEADGNTVQGYKCAETQNLSPSDNLIFGKWDELALLLWGDAVDVMFNRYSLAASNQIQVVITMLCNAIVLRPGFCVSTDAASQ
jgi:Phage capsid family